MTGPEKASLLVAGADIATTAVALNQGAKELNPLFSKGAGSNEEIIARAVVLNAAGHWLMHRYFSHWTEAMQKKGWKIVLGVRIVPVLWNLHEVKR